MISAVSPESQSIIIKNLPLILVIIPIFHEKYSSKSGNVRRA